MTAFHQKCYNDPDYKKRAEAPPLTQPAPALFKYMSKYML